MRKYKFNVRYAVYIESFKNWHTLNKCIEVSANNVFEGVYKANEILKQWLKGRNPELDEALKNRMVFTDVELDI